MLRSCYSTKMRFFRDRPDVETVVDWYFVPDGTEWLPYPTIFNSGNWWSNKQQDAALGEVPGAMRPYRTGQPPAPYPGLAPCGTAENFLRGEATPPVPPVVRLSNGMPECCAPDDGGLLYFGEAETGELLKESTVRYSTTCDVYRTGTAPPAAPAVAGVPILLSGEYYAYPFHPGAAGDVPFSYTHTALIQAPFVDIRQGYNGGAYGFNADNVWIPNKLSGTFMEVVFVEVVQLEGSAAMYQRVYLRAYRPTAFPGTA